MLRKAILVLSLLMFGCNSNGNRIEPNPLDTMESKELIYKILNTYEDSFLISSSPVIIEIRSLYSKGLILRWEEVRNITVIGITFSNESVVLYEKINSIELLGILEKI